MRTEISLVSISLLLVVTIVLVPAVQGQAGSSSEAKNPDQSVATLGNSSEWPVVETRANGSQQSLNPTATDPGKALNDTAIAAQRFNDSGVILLEEGNFEAAATAFQQAIKLDPENAQAHYGLGITQYSLKAFKEASESLKLAIRYKPDWPEAHFRMGLVSYVLGRKKQAVDEYGKLLKLNSPLANSLYRVIRDDDPKANIPEPPPLESNNIVPVSSAVKEPASPPANEPRSVVTEGNTGGEQARAVGDSEGESSTGTNAGNPAPANVALTDIYRVGVGDVLDIRLMNSAANRSTLYTVMNGGVIDMPIAGGAVGVAGLTTDEIQKRIGAELARRAVQEGAQVSVGVREYASHRVIVTGLVNHPGARFLRREAVPLYILMAEAQLRLDAGRITVMRDGNDAHILDLRDPSAFNFLVKPGDVINVTARPQEFYYVGGRINYPGQKVFQPGITLLQAILTAGGVTRESDHKVEISREVSAGRLTTIKYSLRSIKAGKTPDPKLQPGDRIEVVK
ncbi:MAG TPA: tetratricopeptide repeat protein [Pyrinomonadaceae bacterium]|nr:tetratricopeptide repeat protein [Pyrinomonadaceae bacterium]